MTDRATGQTPAIKPRLAATMILIDHDGPFKKVLMGRRHSGHVFMPGKFVFPGGRVEPCDRFMSTSGALSPIIEEKLKKHVTRPAVSRPKALALAAIRETFEETGILLGRKGAGPLAPSPAAAWSAFAEHGVCPCLENLRFVGRAITPPGRPRRFDAHFFVADASEIAHQVEGMIHAETELVELVWIPLAEAKTLDLPSITGVLLEELDKRIDAGMCHDLPVPFFFERNKRWIREEL
ncbi:MAG TPA: NUDIX hydrolase [Beijerinckia sp.]|jgi:8-oxo-dGTP pyrophosphatase MutT (NUDIX family)|nr:NUDIX hydrolase [Beijerinckia sp.]